MAIFLNFLFCSGLAVEWTTSGITAITPQDFDPIFGQNITTLVLENLRFSRLLAGTFVNTPKLQILDLSNNALLR
jgi:hypothetical protein